jgi:hypothetical protein
MRNMVLIASFAVAITSMAGGSAFAAPCKDAKGKFIKCPPPVAMTAPTRCKDAKGKFIKCPGR